MRIKKNIHFFLRSKARKKYGNEIQRDLSIMMELSYNSNRIRIATGLFSDLSKWNKMLEKVTGDNITYKRSAAEINYSLENITRKVNEAFLLFEEKGIIPSVDSVKEIIIFIRDQALESINKGSSVESNTPISSEKVLGQIYNQEDLSSKFQQVTKVVSKSGETTNNDKNEKCEIDNIVKENESEESFWQIYKKFIECNSESCSWSKKTELKFHAMETHLINYRDQIRKVTGDKHYEFTFDSWNEDQFNNFLTFLFDVEDLYNPTVDKVLQNFRWFLKWALQHGYNKNNFFDSFHPKLKMTQRKVIYLNRKELNQLINYKIPESKLYLHRVRDVFLFLCYTSLRYSDVDNLKTYDVHEDYIDITTVKTNDSLRIELNKYSRALINKYKGMKFPNNKVFPVISNQRMNKYLKELCEDVGINEKVRMTTYKRMKRYDKVYPKWKLIGTHCGRRTFVCNALSMGISPQIVMKWTGHNNYASMKPYIDIADEIKEQSMKKFDTIFDE